MSPLTTTVRQDRYASMTHAQLDAEIERIRTAQEVLEEQVANLERLRCAAAVERVAREHSR